MQASITPDREGRFIVSCPVEMEWLVRADLVEAFKSATKGQAVQGVIIDMGGVAFINSAGLGAIFSLRKHLKGLGAAMVMARPSVTITRLLTTVNMPALVPVADSMEQARRQLASPAGANLV
jgi:anti-anti-sigma factor